MNPKYHLLAAVAALGLCACTTDDTYTGPEIGGGYKLSFTVAEDSETRTTLAKDEKGADILQWKSADEVGVYTVGTNTNSNILTTADVSTNPVQFSGTLNQSLSSNDKFYAYYPYDAKQSTDPTKVKLSIPSMQKQTEAGVYNGETHPLVAVPMEFLMPSDSKDCHLSHVQFRLLGAIVELQLFSSDEALRSEEIRSVTFESENTALAGDFSFDLTTVTNTEEPQIAGYKSKEVTTLLETPAAVPATKDGASLVYLTIAPGQYTGKIVVTTNVAQYTFTLAKAMTFKRAVIKGLPADLAKVTRDVISSVDNPIEAKDEQIKATSAWADQFFPTQEADKLIDGDKKTEYHSPWEYGIADPTTKFPVTLEFKFDGTKDMDYFKIYQRGNGGTGIIGRYELYYKGEGTANWTPVNKGDLDKTKGGEKICYFPFTLKGVTDLRLVALEGSGNNKNPDNAGKEPEGFVSAYEIEFFHQPAKATINEAIQGVFTDLSCSELKEGVTQSDIMRLNAIAPYLAQEVAFVMLENRYEPAEAEFRIHTYEPYSDTRLYKKFLTKMYSRMDNPTGIEAKVGDKLMVCVDKIPAGQSVSLAIYGEYANGYGPNYGGMDPNNDTVDQEQELQAGLNIIEVTAPRGGMCYVMNTAAQLSEASQPVRVHILRGCGTVQGYFDLERHKTNEKYVELLSKCTYKYFVVKGKRMMFNLHADQLRKDAPTDILSGINAWDNILGWQLELMGLENVSYFNNHVMAVSSSKEGTYMDASHRRVNFSINDLYKIITYEQLTAAEDNAWGPSHELGHVNQGAINWKSCSESSNNLFSNYTIYKMGKYGSRGAKISDLALNYALGKSWVLAGSSTHQNEDTELHLRMNWQLWNYFHRCGAKPDFWPTLFRLLRENPMPSEFSSNEDPGACQLAFYERACDAAQLDLTEFFETWGFFIPVDIEYSQYGTRQYTVTDKMIAEAKARVAKKWGNAKAPAIQYIEDRQDKNGVNYSDMGYYETFRDKTNITETISCMISGRTYIMFSNSEAVAVEIRKPEVNGELGKLVYFSNMNSFTVPEGVDLSGTVIYAVQWNGKRVKVN